MVHPLPLPLGKVTERSGDGGGTQDCKALSVTFGDSSPRGRANGQYVVNSMLSREMERIFIDTLH